MKSPCVILVTVGLLLLGGLVMIHSITNSALWISRATAESGNLFDRQLVWIALGLVCLSITARADYHIWRRYASPLLGCAFGLLILVQFIPDDGTRYLLLRSIYAQPAHAATLILILWLAHVLAGADDRAEGISDRTGYVALGGTIAMAVAVYFVPDSGSFFLLVAGALVMMLLGGVKKSVLAMACFQATCLVLLDIMQDAGRMGRLMAMFWKWTHPGAFEVYSWWWPLEAMKEGGWIGKGLGGGETFRWFIGESPREFITAVIGETTGLVGLGAVFALLLVLVVSGCRVAVGSDRFGRLLGAGLACWLGFQALLNVGVMTRCLSIRAPPLPFVSQCEGGVIVCLIATGMLMSLSRRVV